jgi:hypothetical protein
VIANRSEGTSIKVFMSWWLLASRRVLRDASFLADSACSLLPERSSGHFVKCLQQKRLLWRSFDQSATGEPDPWL